MTTTTKRPDGGELKPCPFCGDRAWFSGFVVQCKSCGASLIKQERGAAIEAWNTRTPSNESHAPQADETANDIADALERSTQSMARECKVGMGLWNGHSNACLNAIALLRKAAVPAPQPPVEGLREDVKRWKLVDGKVTTGESVIFDGSFIIAKVTRREDAELILALLSRDKLQS